MKYTIGQEVTAEFTGTIFEMGRDVFGNEYYAIEYRDPLTHILTQARGLSEDMLRELLTPEMINKARLQ